MIPADFRQLESTFENQRPALLSALRDKGVVPSKQAVAGFPGRSWVWWSTHESIAAEVPSVWAIAETLMAVILYWAMTIYCETYVFLLAGVVFAPLVLLRSDPSVKRGLKWFQRLEEPNKIPWEKMTAGQRIAFVVSRW